jgi:hypothetical protein
MPHITTSKVLQEPVGAWVVDNRIHSWIAISVNTISSEMESTSVREIVIAQWRSTRAAW